jgi:hypothetical protein
MSNSFSKRYGFRQVRGAPITMRTDAPLELRGVIVQLAYECGFSPRTLRPLVCRTLRKRPDGDNWSEYPNIDNEIHALVDGCEWYRVYDVIEAVAGVMRETPFSYETDRFESELNDYFVENGIGWKLVAGRIEVRGDAIFEESIRRAGEHLQTSGFSTATNELREAIGDLSRRPAPDVTGAIQHSMAALECVARAVCRNEKATLGEILKQHRGVIPRPLDEAVAKLWGFASENARHVSEGREPSFAEAELLVGVVAGVVTYLTKKQQPCPSTCRR